MRRWVELETRAPRKSGPDPRAPGAARIISAAGIGQEAEATRSPSPGVPHSIVRWDPPHSAACVKVPSSSRGVQPSEPLGDPSLQGEGGF